MGWLPGLDRLIKSNKAMEIANNESVRDFFETRGWRKDVPSYPYDAVGYTLHGFELKKLAAAFARSYLKKYPDSIRPGSIVSDDHWYTLKNTYEVADGYEPASELISVVYTEYQGSAGRQDILTSGTRKTASLKRGDVYAINVADEFIELIHRPEK